MMKNVHSEYVFRGFVLGYFLCRSRAACGAYSSSLSSGHSWSYQRVLGVQVDVEQKATTQLVNAYYTVYRY